MCVCVSPESSGMFKGDTRDSDNKRVTAVTVGTRGPPSNVKPRSPLHSLSTPLQQTLATPSPAAAAATDAVVAVDPLSAAQC